MRLQSRRSVLILLAAAPFAVPAAASDKPEIAVFKDPDCGCCSGWVDHLRQNAFPVRVTETAKLQPIKARLGVPSDLASCHTAEVGGYVIEGHVPASAIERLLRERPAAIGLAVPGMPIGSPGMEGENAKPYEVILFAKGRREVFARYLRDEVL
jgi:hypothetical protein